MLLALVALLTMLVVLWRLNNSRESTSAWWEGACTSGAAGLILTYFGNVQGHLAADADTLIGSASAGVNYVAGFNALEIALRFAVVGAIIGAARHPAVLAQLRPVGEPIGQQLRPVFADVAARLTLGTARSRLSGSSAPSPEISNGQASSLPAWEDTRVVQGVQAVGLGVAALLVAVPVSLILGKGLLFASSVLTDGPNDIVAQVEATIRDGDGRALSDMIGLPVDQRILSSPGGVQDVSGSLDDDTGDDYRTGTVSWRGDGAAGSSQVSIVRASEGGMFGLVPAWELNAVPDLPTVYGTTTAIDGSMVATTVQVDGVDIPADTSRNVMPGSLNVSAVASANSQWVTGAVTAPINTITESVAIPVTYTVTPAGNTQAVTSAGAALTACSSATNAVGCPSNFGCWASSPTVLGLYGIARAVGPNSLVVPMVPGALKYGTNPYFGGCTPDIPLTAPMDLTVTSSGMVVRE